MKLSRISERGGTFCPPSVARVNCSPHLPLTVNNSPQLLFTVQIVSCRLQTPQGFRRPTGRLWAVGCLLTGVIQPRRCCRGQRGQPGRRQIAGAADGRGGRCALCRPEGVRLGGGKYSDPKLSPARPPSSLMGDGCYRSRRRIRSR